MLRRLPRILKFIPGKAQDLRAYFLCMQYWLAGSDDNVEAMIAFLVDKYARGPRALDPRRRRAGRIPRDRPLPPRPARADDRPTPPDIPGPAGATGTVGLLLMRAYVLVRRHRRTTTR